MDGNDLTKPGSSIWKKWKENNLQLSKSLRDKLAEAQYNTNHKLTANYQMMQRCGNRGRDGTNIGQESNDRGDSELKQKVEVESRGYKNSADSRYEDSPEKWISKSSPFDSKFDGNNSNEIESKSNRTKPYNSTAADTPNITTEKIERLQNRMEDIEIQPSNATDLERRRAIDKVNRWFRRNEGITPENSWDKYYYFGTSRH